MATTHVPTHINNNNHMDSLNGKGFHTHIPRIYDGVNKTFNSPQVAGGGMLECGICGEVLLDSRN